MNIADSLGLFMPLNQHTILQLAKLFYRFEHASQLKLLKVGVQQQIGLIDCGVFAIAYAVELCHGSNPEKVIFLQKQMRQHLYTCLQNKRLTPFPKGEDTDDTLPRPQRNLFTIKLYCTCRMPDIYDEKMINCDRCQKWYHFRCVDMALGEVAPPPTQWMCNDCM